MLAGLLPSHYYEGESVPFYEGESVPFLPPSSGGLLASSTFLGTTLISAFIFTWGPLCVHTYVQISPFKISVILDDFNLTNYIHSNSISNKVTHPEVLEVRTSPYEFFFFFFF